MKRKNSSCKSKLLTTDMLPEISTPPAAMDKFMSTKPMPDTTQNPEDFKDTNLKYNLSKFEYDLYHEEDDVAEKIIRVKRFSLPNNGERWKIFEDNKAVLIIEGSKCTKKEREFLRSAVGLNWLLNQFKSGIKSFNHFKQGLKLELNR